MGQTPNYWLDPTRLTSSWTRPAETYKSATQLRWGLYEDLTDTRVDRTHVQGRSDGGYIGIYTPPNQSTLIFLCGGSVSLQGLVNIYTHPNQIPGYASAHVPSLRHELAVKV